MAFANITFEGGQKRKVVEIDILDLGPVDFGGKVYTVGIDEEGALLIDPNGELTDVPYGTNISITSGNQTMRVKPVI